MSVHGEYSRALEALLSSIRQVDTDDAKHWATALEAARFSQHEDLCAAAEQCLVALAQIERGRDLLAARGFGLDADALWDPYQHLLAHCRSVLGTTS